MEGYTNLTNDGGIQKKILVSGNGPVAVNGKKCTVHYTGTFQDGKVFDSSVERGKPFEFNLGAGQVIKGWDQGVLSMNQGEKAHFILAPAYAYGSRGAGGVIPPNATLCFEVEFIKQ
jgi:FKBP-type peptidyl-prolyl cis-trans isomerase